MSKRRRQGCWERDITTTDGTSITYRAHTRGALDAQTVAALDQLAAAAYEHLRALSAEQRKQLSARTYEHFNAMRTAQPLDDATASTATEGTSDEQRAQ